MPRFWRYEPTLPGFNGAGMFPSQKSRWRRPRGSSSTWLQWGRDVSIPEMSGLPTSGKLFVLLQWGRDVSIPEIRGGRFDLIGEGLASMGPGCFHPRNEGGAVKVTSSASLQWGRDVSIPEMRQWQRAPVVLWLLQWGRDVSIPEIWGPLGANGRPLRFNGAGMFPSQKSHHAAEQLVR